MAFGPRPEYMMDLALREARRGLGKTRTNPLVGASMFHRGHLIGRGAHRKFGGDHAERELLRGVKKIPNGAIIACTLEPCVHSGKTSPCVDRLLEAGVRHLIVSAVDPNPRVNGKGIEKLRQNGVKVEVGIRERSYRWLNRAYFYHLATDMPYLEVKLAMTANGRIATDSGDSQWITGEQSRARGHRLRARCDAVMVGAETVRNDDPTLTDRVTDRSEQPRGIVVCRNPDELPDQATLFTERAGDTIVLVPDRRRDSLPDWLESSAVKPVYAPLKDQRYNWPRALKQLGNLGMNRILVEGGGKLVGSLLESGTVAEWHLFYSGILLGPGRESLSLSGSPEKIGGAKNGRLLAVENLGNDVYVHRALEEPFRQAGMNGLPVEFSELSEEVY